MKVLLINGSPHEKGCTYTALSLIAGELNASGIETEILNVGTKPVGGCIGFVPTFRISVSMPLAFSSPAIRDRAV